MLGPNDAKQKIAEALRKQLLESIDAKHLKVYCKSYFKRWFRHLRQKNWYSIRTPWFFWVNGQYAFGLLANHTPEDLKALYQFYDRVLFLFRRKLFCFDKPDMLIHAYVVLMLYLNDHKHKYKALIQAARDYIILEARDNSGLVPYRSGDDDFYVDTVGMITAFCYEYSRSFQDNELKVLADQQLEYLIERSEAAGAVLPCHVYHLNTGESNGPNTWGRGAGWYLLGLIEGAVNSPFQFGSAYNRAILYVFKQQDAQGFLYDDLQEKNHIDTSITSMAAYALAKGLKNGLVVPEEAALLKEKLLHAVEALLSSVDEFGHVLNSSGECIDVGQYSTKFGNYFSQGYTLATLSIMQHLSY